MKSAHSNLNDRGWAQLNPKSTWLSRGNLQAVLLLAIVFGTSIVF